MLFIASSSPPTMRSRECVCWLCSRWTIQRSGPGSIGWTSTIVSATRTASGEASLAASMRPSSPRCRSQYSGSSAFSPATCGHMSIVGGPSTVVVTPGRSSSKLIGDPAKT